MTHQPQLIPEQPTAEQAAREAERAEYLERLREKLQDPEFRAIEGFPLGEDEDILALSDPPYYTACPNPFLPEILARWQAERVQIRKELGLPDDADDNGDNGRPVYHREPFAIDVAVGKGDSIYTAHSYHTKVPHKAIMRYILHYTDPDDVIFDGFCGTGMTGVAAQLCSDKQTVESLGYRVKKDDTVLDEKGQRISRLGPRKAVLLDLSPAATFIAYNYNTPVDVAVFERQAKRVVREVEAECVWMYETTHVDGKAKGIINYTVWSDVFACPECGGEMIFWDVAVDKEVGKVRPTFACPHCSVEHSKRKLERAWETVFDQALGTTLRRAKQVPVLINYSVGRKRYEKQPDDDDLALLQKVDESEIPHWFPTTPLPDGYNTRQPMQSHGITHVHHFYSRRNLWVLAAIWEHLRTQDLSPLCDFWFTSTLPWTTRQNRFLLSNYFRGGGGVVAPSLPGTLYVSSLGLETNPLERFKLRIRSARFTASHPGFTVTCQSATQLSYIPDNSVDYIFVDPPFGGNLMYSELNLTTESWLRVRTEANPEAIINRVQEKDLLEYLRLMEACFREFFRLLKPGRWMTVEFHNSQNAVWNSIQEAILRAGFIVADMRILEKTHKTFKQVTTTNAVKKDLAITAYKPRVHFERRFSALGGSEEGAWDFVRQHLGQLPVVVKQDGVLEVIAERQAYLLYDRMVAFHIQRGFSVDGQDGIAQPIGMHGYRLEVETHIITASAASVWPASSACCAISRACGISC